MTTTTVKTLEELPSVSVPSRIRATQKKVEYFFAYDITSPAGVVLAMSKKPFAKDEFAETDKIQLNASSPASAKAQAKKTVRSQFCKLHSLPLSTSNILIHVESTFTQVLHVNKKATRIARRVGRITSK